MTDSTPGWQVDPTGKHDHRYWDGSQWTENVSDAGVASTDPYVADADATVAEVPAADATAAPEPPAAVDPTAVDPAPTAPDATAAWPVAPVAPGSPAPPPPYVPTGPVSPGGSGSNRGLLVGGGILAAIAIAVIAFLALGGDDDETSDIRAQLATTLEREADLSKSDAECVADFFVDDLGEDAFEGVDFSAADPPEELQSAFVESGFKAVEECNLDASAFGSDGSDTTEGSTDSGDEDLESLRDECADGDFPACDDLYFAADVGSELEEFGSTCGGIADPQDGFCEESNGGEDDASTDDGGLTDGSDLPDNYAEILEQSLGITREQAECLTDRITSAIEDGDATPEDAASGIVGYLNDCDIDPQEIGAN